MFLYIGWLSHDKVAIVVYIFGYNMDHDLIQYCMYWNWDAMGNPVSWTGMVVGLGGVSYCLSDI